MLKITSVNYSYPKSIEQLKDLNCSASYFIKELDAIRKEIKEIENKIKNYNASFFSNEFHSFTTQYEILQRRYKSIIDKMDRNNKKDAVLKNILDMCNISFDNLEIETNKREANNKQSDNNDKRNNNNTMNKMINNSSTKSLNNNEQNKMIENIFDCSTNSQIDQKNRCVLCDSVGKMDVIDGVIVCKNCGYSEKYITDNMNSYKDQSSQHTNTFSYKKLNHFNEWINQIQGKEVTKVPTEVFEKIYGEIKKERITNLSIITQKKVRYFLKKLGLNKYYEHVPFITKHIGGESPPSISPYFETNLRQMFISVSAPFLEYCPANRRNFPRYTFILYKCCELLGYNEILPYLPLLKTKTRLIEMDRIWKTITVLLKYKYIPTI